MVLSEDFFLVIIIGFTLLIFVCYGIVYYLFIQKLNEYGRDKKNNDNYDPCVNNEVIVSTSYFDDDINENITETTSLLSNDILDDYEMV